MSESFLNETSIQEVTDFFQNTPLPVVMKSFENIDESEIAVILLLLVRASSHDMSNNPDEIRKALARSDDKISKTETERTPTYYAQQIFAQFPMTRQIRLGEEIASTEMVDTDKAKEIWNNLIGRMKGVLENTLFFGDGAKNLAKLLVQVDIEQQNQLMEILQDKNPKLANTVGDHLFTFEDLIDMPDEAILTVLQVLEPSILALALHNAPAAIIEKFFENMSADQLEAVESETKKLTFEQKQISGTAQQSVVSLVRNFAGKGLLKIR